MATWSAHVHVHSTFLKLTALHFKSRVRERLPQQSGASHNIPFKTEINGREREREREGGAKLRVLIFVLLFRRFSDSDDGRGGRNSGSTCACGGPAVGTVGRRERKVPNGVPRRDAPPRRNSFP